MNPNNVKNSSPFKLQAAPALYGTDCRSWLSLFTKQTKITTRCREHDLQGLQCCMLRTAAERIMISLQRLSVGIVQTQSVRQTKILIILLSRFRKKCGTNLKCIPGISSELSMPRSDNMNFLLTSPSPSPKSQVQAQRERGIWTLG